MNYEGEKFLLKLYRELYNKESVKHSGTISDNKYELINKYLNRIEKTERVFLSDKKEVIKYLKNRYYDKYVIREEDILSDRKDTKEKIINSQKESLDNWLDYLMIESTYPMWARFWAFQGMLKLGQYDKDNKTFSKRSKRTTSPFIELNKDALKETMNLVINTIENNKPNDNILERFIENGSFGKIYAYHISKQIEKQQRSNVEEGIWKAYRYNEGKKLANDISTYNTGWCLTSETISNNYLELGSIYIYYTKDEKGNYAIPRICIRQEDISVAEVKGVFDQKCNLEYSMIDIAIEKLNKLHGSDIFKKIGENVKRVTMMVEKQQKQIPFSIEDLRFLYEIDEEIENFTHYKDSRIIDILDERNIKEDLSRIFNCSPEKICTNKKELKNSDFDIYYGNIDYQEGENIIVPPIVIGNIDLQESESAIGFENLQKVSGSLVGPNIIKAENFKNLRLITKNLGMPRLKSAIGFENLQKVGKVISLPALESLKGLNSLKETGSFNIKNAKYSEGIESLETVKGTLDISNMIDLSGFESLKTVEKNVICYASNSLNNLPDLEVKGDIHFYHIINIHNIFGKQRTRKR